MNDFKNILLLIVKWGSVAFGLLIVAMIGAYISIKISVIGTEVAVPDVTDVTVENAYGILSDKGLFLEVEGEKNDESIADGKILSQDPPEGAKIRKGRKVKVIVSLGTKRIQTPNLSKETARSAKIHVAEEDLIIGSVSYIDSDIEEGKIVAQSPPPGSDKLKGGSVNVLVSRGKEKKTYIMPDIVEKEYYYIEPVLKSYGMRVSVTKKEKVLNSRHGRIISQFPLSGYPVAEGEAVSITIVD